MTAAFAGIDIGGQSFKAALVDESAAVLATETVTTGPSTSLSSLSAAISDVVRNFSAVAPITALGCGVAGSVTHDGSLHGCPNLPNLCGLGLASTLQEYLGIPVVADNDAHCHAIAEGWTGSTAGVDSFLLVTLGSGLGSGLVLDNKVYRGVTGFGCELGHMIIVASGRLCGCGNRGCLEAYVSEMAIRESVRSRGGDLAKRVDSRLADGALGHAEVLFGLADDNDDDATSVVCELVEMLGIGLASAINVFDVTTIVLGGGIAPGVIRRLPALRRALDGALFARDEEAVSILPASTGRWAGAVGAARLAMS